jgi:CDP-6-deoxy-D-xylo-4-hexulose-3-dehydrase
MGDGEEREVAPPAPLTPGKEPSEELQGARQAVLDAARRYHALKFGGEEPFDPDQTVIRYAGRVFDEHELLHLVDASLDMWLTSGRFAAALEKRLARHYGVRHASLVNSGSSANLAAVFTLTSPKLGERRLRPGDEVITAAAGFPTTIAPIVQAGAIPVFVDTTLSTYNPSLEAIEAAISERTRAIVLAHTLGNPFPVAEVAELARRHQLFLVEDNCDAAGSRYRDRATGTFGHLATLSFYPPHHMTTGEGGAVLASTPLLNTIVESFRDWGRDCWCPSGKDNTCGKRFEWELGSLPLGYDHKYIYSHLGFNLKISDMQAAVGCAQLEKLDAFCQARRNNWRFYRQALARFEEALILPEPTPGADPSWFGFPITVRPDAPFTRAELVAALESRRIATRMLFAGNILRQPAFAGVKHRVVGDLRVTDQVMRDTFWIGVYPGLSAAMRAHVVGVFEHFMSGRRSRGMVVVG